jgi:hypothetical protein
MCSVPNEFYPFTHFVWLEFGYRPLYQTTRQHIPEDCTHNIHGRDNLKSHTVQADLWDVTHGFELRSSCASSRARERMNTDFPSSVSLAASCLLEDNADVSTAFSYTLLSLMSSSFLTLFQIEGLCNS